MEPPNFTAAVRQELASRPLGTDADVAAELAGLARFAGSLTVAGGSQPLRLALTSSSGAVARRAFLLLQRGYGFRAELAVRAAGGVRRQTGYQVRIPDARRLATDLGLLDGSGHPAQQLFPGLRPETVPAYLRAVVMAAASFSSPGRPAHLEVTVGSSAVAQALADLLRAHVGAATWVAAERPHRVVLKSGAVIGDLLVLVGAPGAFMRWDERRFRHQLRNEANRLANADAANVNRTIRAASAQVAGVERAIEQQGWDGLDAELHDVALARLANPAASLQEIGELLDPPVGKSTVHRRIRRLLRLADDGGDG